MNQGLALEILLTGESAFLTGPAGTGKTFLLNQFIKFAKADGKHVSVTASTGLAATHLGGTTIHAWSGIGIHDVLHPGFADRISKSRKQIIESTDVLVIDEVSMLHDYRLDMVDEVCRAVRERPEEPFGGIQVIMSGDFFQLPPVNRRDSREGGFVVTSNVWQELDPVIIYLDEQFRQNDDDLRSILDAIRAGDVRRNHAEKLLERTKVEPDEDQDITELHTTNVNVDTINARRLERLEGDEVSYQSSHTGSANYVENLARSILAPETLTLKEGALVMAVRNATDRRYANGSIGKVIDFEPVSDYPVVEFRNGRTMTVVPETWELRDGDKKRASISQIPLRLAWAITVHKSQGMTLDAAKIDLRKAFVEGMGYVALSRVRSLDTLYLAGINRMALAVSQTALEIDEQLRHKGAQAVTRFGHLSKKINERTKEMESLTTKKSSDGTSWKDKIEKMRETYPNAYKPWTNIQDEDLKLGFRNGETVEKLSKKLGRHEGSVKMRLQKHFGEDVIS